MPPRSGLKRKKIEAGDPPFILEGKSPEPADNSAAGSFFEGGPERPGSSPHGSSTYCAAAPSLQRQRRRSFG
jgi:hypothetical protein